MPVPPLRAMVVWQKSALTARQQALLRDATTFANPAFFQRQHRGFGLGAAPPRLLMAHDETEDALWLPRHLPWTDFGLPSPVPEIPRRPRVSVTFTRRLLAHQWEAASRLQGHLQKGWDGILSLPCGRGKTVVALYGWAMSMKTPMLAVVPTLQLADQWRERALEFTSLTEDDLGMIGRGEDTWDRPFVVATIQSLARKTFPSECYTRFGTVFFDEVHRLGAPYFSLVGGQFDATRIGLSATWQRADGMERLFQCHVGPIFYEDRAQPLTPKIYFLPTSASLDVARFRLWGRAGEINYARLITTLSRDQERRAQVINVLLRVFRTGRKILVLGDRKEELVAYQESLRAQGISCGLCVGSLDGRAVSAEDRDRALQQSVILATSQLVKEGLDQADMDTLVILYPQANQAFAEQAVGRILREHPGKRRPVVLVLWDHGVGGTLMGRRVRPFTSVCQKMGRHLETLGYEVVHGDGPLHLLV